MATTAQSEDVNSFTSINDLMCGVCNGRENIYHVPGVGQLRFLCLDHLETHSIFVAGGHKRQA